MSDLIAASGGKVWTPENEEESARAQFPASNTYARIVLYFSAIFLLVGFVLMSIFNVMGHADGDIWVRSNIRMLLMSLFFVGFAAVLVSTLIKHRSILFSISAIVLAFAYFSLFVGALLVGIANYFPSTAWVAEQAFGDDAVSWSKVSDGTNDSDANQVTFVNESGETRTAKLVEVDESGIQGIKVELEPKSGVGVTAQPEIG